MEAALSDIWQTDDGLYLGFSAAALRGKDPHYDIRLSYGRDRHVVTLGPNGSGKSRRLLLINLAVLLGWSIVVIDPKGNLAPMTMGHREAKGSDCIPLNPFGAFEVKSKKFNPVMSLDPMSPNFVQDCNNIAHAMIEVDPRSPHWGQGARGLVSGLIMFTRLTWQVADKSGELLRGNLGHVRDCIGADLPEFKEIIKEAIGLEHDLAMQASAPASAFRSLKNKLSRYRNITADDREAVDIKGTAHAQTEWLDTPAIREDLNGPDRNFADLRKKPTTIYLTLPADYLTEQAPWLRIVITSIIKDLLRVPDKPQVPTLIMVDEAGQIGNIKIIDEKQALMREYGIKLWMVFQDLNQMQFCYGKRWESLIANSGVFNTFSTNDSVSSEYVSKRMGVHSVAHENISMQTQADNKPPNPSFSGKDQIIPVLYPQDIEAIGEGYNIIFSHHINGEETEGPTYSYLPWPDEFEFMRPIMALDPSR